MDDLFDASDLVDMEGEMKLACEEAEVIQLQLMQHTVHML